MSQELDTVKTGAVSLSAALLGNIKAVTAASKIGTYRYLQFKGDRGEYTTNDLDRVEHVLKVGTQFYVNVVGIYHGWKCWKDKKPVGTEMVALLKSAQIPPADSLPDHGPYEDPEREGWREAIDFPMRGVDDKQEYIFSIGSVSGVKAMKRFLAKIVQDVVSGKNLETQMPLVELAADSFVVSGGKAKGKKIPLPKLNIVKWVDISEVSPEFTLTAKPTSDEDAGQPLPNGRVVGSNEDI